MLYNNLKEEITKFKLKDSVRLYEFNDLRFELIEYNNKREKMKVIANIILFVILFKIIFLSILNIKTIQDLGLIISYLIVLEICLILYLVIRITKLDEYMYKLLDKYILVDKNIIDDINLYINFNLKYKGLDKDDITLEDILLNKKFKSNYYSSSGNLIEYYNKIKDKHCFGYCINLERNFKNNYGIKSLGEIKSYK